METYKAGFDRLALIVLIAVGHSSTITAGEQLWPTIYLRRATIKTNPQW